MSFLAIIAGSGFFVANLLQLDGRTYNPFIKPCRTPIRYSIGPVDTRFDIRYDQFKKILAEAENVWEKPACLNLFEYDPDAPLRIKMAYDGRQQATSEARSLEAELEALNAKQAALNRQYTGLNAQYNQKSDALKKDIADYEKDLKDYNKDVAYWNGRGGAPADEYDELKEEQDDLKKRYDKLKKQENELNDLAKQINAIAAQENKIVSNYNSEVTTFQNKYGGTQEFEKGVFDSAAGITIYQFKENDDLLLTLIHELGHALGMQHVQNPRSIMYYLMGEQDLDNPTLTAEDMAELKSACALN